MSTRTLVGIACGALLVMSLATLACHEVSDGGPTAVPPPPPCAGVYDAAVNSCVAASGCIGIECFYVWDRCSADAKRGPLLDCCAAHYATAEEIQACVDGLGQGP